MIKKSQVNLDFLLLADRLAILFLVLSGFFLLIHSPAGFAYLKYGLANLLLAGVIWVLAKNDPEMLLLRLLRVCYPLAVIFFTHLEVELFIHILYGKDFTFDSLVESWDALLFGANPHLHFHSVLPQGYWAELWHLFYVSYYPLLVGSILWMWVRRPDDFSRFIFIYLGIFLSFVVVFSLFPVIGPLDYRVGIFEGKSVLAAIVDTLFHIGAPDGAAFPSSHVGLSTGIYLLLRPMKPVVSTGIVIIILGIGISMVYASIHYAIDAVAGLIAGWLLYHVWDTLYYMLTNYTVYRQEREYSE